jgi:hypothetical protein
MAFDFVSAAAHLGAFITEGSTQQEAPPQITLTFSPGTKVDPQSIGSGISVIRGGNGVIGDSDDILVVPGSITVDDLPNQNSVVIRFADRSAQSAEGARVDLRGLQQIQHARGHQHFVDLVNDAVAGIQVGRGHRGHGEGRIGELDATGGVQAQRGFAGGVNAFDGSAGLIQAVNSTRGGKEFAFALSSAEGQRRNGLIQASLYEDAGATAERTGYFNAAGKLGMAAASYSSIGGAPGAERAGGAAPVTDRSTYIGTVS